MRGHLINKPFSGGFRMLGRAQAVAQVEELLRQVGASSSRGRPILSGDAGRLIPVFPVVPSTMTPRGRKNPRSSASAMIANTAQYLNEPPGFRNSALPRIVHPVR
jgi:hypothetical protein